MEVKKLINRFGSYIYTPTPTQISIKKLACIELEDELRITLQESLHFFRIFAM